MHPSIPYLIALCVLIWFSHALTKIFRREADPMRRRDLTLAGAEKGEALELRISRTSKPILLSVLSVFSFEILLFVWSMLDHRVGPLQTSIARGLSVTIVLLFTIPMCFVVVALISARACRANRPLSSWATILGVVVPVIALLPLPRLVSLGIRVFDLLDRGGLVTVLMLAVLAATALVMGFVVIYMPRFALGRFKKAIPYSE
jgi:hypothetical protein